MQFASHPHSLGDATSGEQGDVDLGDRAGHHSRRDDGRGKVNVATQALELLRLAGFAAREGGGWVRSTINRTRRTSRPP